MNIYASGYSTEVDGPGTRLIYYLKGCNFHCDWCGAPESISPERQQLRYPDRTVWAGEEISPERIFRKAENAGGLISGITFGGGEPTLQAGELAPLLEKLRGAGIHTAIESNASTLTYPEIVLRTDLVFSDLKTVDEQRFTRRIADDARQLHKVLENLRFAAIHCREFVVRIPVVHGLNDDESAQQKMALFLQELSELRAEKTLNVQLLRQHHLAEPKYRALGLPSSCERDEVSPETVSGFAAILKKFNLNVMDSGGKK